MAQLLGIKKVAPVPVDTIEYVDLRVTGDEADALYDILCKVGGHPSGKRRHAATLLITLREVYPGRDYQVGPDLDGSIYFKGQ